MTRLADLVNGWRTNLPKPVQPFADVDFLGGCAFGALIGLWAVHSHAIESTESTDLYVVAGAAVGLLAATLAVLALLMGFISGRTASIIRSVKGGTDEFFRSFKFVVRVSGLSVIASVVGAVEASSVQLSDTGTSGVLAVAFGVAIWFFIWATIGTVQLVKTVLDYGRIRTNAEADMYLVEDEERGE